MNYEIKKSKTNYTKLANSVGSTQEDAPDVIEITDSKRYSIGTSARP